MTEQEKVLLKSLRDQGYAVVTFTPDEIPKRKWSAASSRWATRSSKTTKSLERKKMRKSNEEVIVELMNHSKFGAIIQPFVLEGLRRYSEQVLRAQPGFMAGGLISEEAWRGCAQETVNALNEHFGAAVQDAATPVEAAEVQDGETDEDLMKFELTITGWVELNGMDADEAEDELRQNLEQVTQQAMGDGMVTGSSPLTINRYQENIQVEYQG